MRFDYRRRSLFAWLCLSLLGFGKLCLVLLGLAFLFLFPPFRLPSLAFSCRCFPTLTFAFVSLCLALALNFSSALLLVYTRTVFALLLRIRFAPVRSAPTYIHLVHTQFFSYSLLRIPLASMIRSTCIRIHLCSYCLHSYSACISLGFALPLLFLVRCACLFFQGGRASCWRPASWRCSSSRA